MKNSAFFTLVIFYSAALYAQPTKPPRINQFIDIAGTAGNSEQSVAGSYVFNWRIGKKRKWEAGFGIRSTSYFGTKKDFRTAPARLARSTTTPFIILFAGQKTENWDTLTVQHPFINSVNVSVNFGYNFSPKWSGGFNIDLIGFSFGRKSSAILTSNGITKTDPGAFTPAFNVLLTGDNDYGSLNSEFFIKYKLSQHWGVRAIYQFYFGEYKTNTVKQTAPDGTIVDRFRNKANTYGAGVSWYL
jgi:hypothetical protein